MKSLLFLILSMAVLCAGVSAQTAPDTKPTETKPSVSEEKPKRVSFRANKEQVTQAQEMLKGKGIFSGEATGKYSPELRTAIRSYQKDNGLRSSGSLNRATLEKMGIALTDAQKAIPVRENDIAKPKTSDTASNDDKPKRVIFRATKDQIEEAQAKLKIGGMYSGDTTGTLDDATRESLKKYQEANGLTVTGTLNRVTLEKMGITLTEKQKSDAAAEGQK